MQHENIKFDKVFRGRYSAPQQTAARIRREIWLAGNFDKAALTAMPSHDRLYLSWIDRKMAESIGDKLRLARETRGIALRDISDQTRISMRYLEAIETGDYRRLPGGIFNRSFIRAYAKFVGYDEQEAIEEYTSALRQQGEVEEDVPKAHRSLVYTDDTEGPGRSPMRTLLLAILILAILSLAVWAGLHFYQTRFGSSRSEIGRATLLSALSLQQFCASVKEEKHAFFV